MSIKPKEPEQAPVGVVGSWKRNENGVYITTILGMVELGFDDKVYTTPPQRTWVGLTDEERDHIWHTVGNSDAHGDVDGWSGRDVMSAIEAKLKEKNNG